MTQATLMARLWRLYPRFKQPRSAWLVSGLAVLVAAALEPAIPALIKPLLDSGFTEGAIPLWMIPIALVLLFSVRGMASFLYAVGLAKIAQHSLQRLRSELFRHVSLAELKLFKDQPATALANTLVFESSTGAILLLQSINALAKDSLTIVALLAYLFYLNWKLTLIVACLFPLMAVFMRVMTKRLYRLTKESQSAVDRLAYTVEESVLAHKEIRLQGAQQQQQERFEGLNALLARVSMKSAVAGSALTPITQLFGALALSAVISIALLESNTRDFSAGSFMAFVTAMLMLIAPIKHLSEIASAITRGLVAMERATALLESVKTEDGGSFQMARCQGELLLRGVHLTYPGAAQAALSDIDLHIAPGQFVALVGLSGSGKTSLAQMLPRLVDYQAGQVLLDGVELKDWDLASLRQQFALVSQNVVMLNDSVLHNVALGQAVDRERALACLEAANLGDFLSRLPEGMDSTIGHNAVSLSGGERQRLAIARAMYKNAPILILDEVTSALDADTERLVQDALRKVMQGKTTIAIAHRLATIRDADQIVVMQAGRIVQQGTHEALLAQGGAYQDFIRLGQH